MLVCAHVCVAFTCEPHAGVCVRARVCVLMEGQKDAATRSWFFQGGLTITSRNMNQLWGDGGGGEGRGGGVWLQLDATVCH